MDDTTIYTGIFHQKTTGIDLQPGLSSNPETQTYLSTQQLTGVTGGTQTSPVRSTQRGGMQTTPPNHPGEITSSGGTQTSPPDLLTTTNMTKVHRVNWIAIRRQRPMLSPREVKAKDPRVRKGRKSHLNSLTPILAHLPTLNQGEI